MRKLLTWIVLIFLASSFSSAKENKKPFFKEYKQHNYKINIINTTVYQQIENFGAFYNTSHLFFEYKLDTSQLIFINTSITFGDGITPRLDKKGYSIYTTGDDLESYLKNINKTGRKYLLEFYYQKEFNNFALIVGLIDSTAFIDVNKYANDEHVQFLNSVFINNPIAVLPSYNLGIYLRYKITKQDYISTIFMDNSPASENVFITQYEKEKDTYGIRIFGFKTTKTNQSGFGISSDYSLQENFGMFFRGGYSNTDYNLFFSLGFEKFKIIFSEDSLGFAYGFVNGKNYLNNINVCEIFYEMKPKKHIEITLDLQYMKEINQDFILGTRLYLSY